MTQKTPRDLILQARKAITQEEWVKADRLYRKAISILGKRKNKSPESKCAFFSANAEYLNQKPYLKDKETFEEFRSRIFDSIRYMNECYKMNTSESDECFSNMYGTIQQFIKLYGCRFPETEHHVIMACPIQLNSDGRGKFGFSVGAYYDRIICSICKLDMLDEHCPHLINEIYDQKKCIPLFENYKIAHFALVNRPKNPRGQIDQLIIPKEEFLRDASIDSSKVDLKNLNIKCTRCREENIEPTIIEADKFFEMQGLSISFNKQPRLLARKNKYEKGGHYFGFTYDWNY